MMTQADYLHSKLAYLQGLKEPTEQQQLLILLADKPDRSAAENKQLAILLKAEQTADQAKAAQHQAAKLLGQRKDAERKARNHRLILQGLLLDLAGLDNWDRGELLGALLALQESQNVPPERRQQWKQRGEALLAEKAQEGSKREKQANIPPPPAGHQAVTPPGDTSTATFTPRSDRDRL